MTIALDPLREAPRIGRRPGPVPRLSAALSILSFVLAAAAVVVARWNRLGGGEVVAVFLVLSWTGAGTVMARREPGNPLSTILLVGTAVAAASMLVVDAGLGTRTTAAAVAVQWTVLPVLGLHVLLSLPDGRLGTRSRAWALGLCYVLGLLLGIDTWQRWPDLHEWPFAAGLAVVLFLGCLAAGARYRRHPAADRHATQLMAWTAAVVLVTGLDVAAARLFLGWPPVTTEVLAALTAAVPLAVIVGLRGRPGTGLRRLVTVSVAALGLSTLALAVFVVVVVGLGRAPTAQEKSILLVSVAASAVTALAWLPVRHRLASLANRMLYGERPPPDQALRTVGARMSRALPMDELLLQLAESLHDTMALRSAEIWTGSSGVFDRSVSVPEKGRADLVFQDTESAVVARAPVSGAAWVRVWLADLVAGRDQSHLRVAPIAYSEQLLGLIVVERAPAAEPFTQNHEQVLAELARQLAVALHNVRLDSALQASLDEVSRKAEELQASRARIVSAADAERRRIERDLHDGAQQHLVALAVKLRLARGIVNDRSDEVEAMFDDLTTTVKETLQELRDLAHGIYPPLLAQTGLWQALSAATAKAALPAKVDTSDIGRYPPEIEAAVYFCCLEALQNAAKHAGAGVRAVVRVWEDAGALLFEVADDGAGFDVSRLGGGVGFVNMADRVGAIGGRLRVDSEPGRGTSIRGTIPIE